MGQSSNPHHVLQTRMKLDRGLYQNEGEEFIEVDIDPTVESEDVNELIEEFGYEQVSLAYYYLHRRRLWKMRVLRTSELDTDDLVAFMLVDEEHGLKDAEQAAKMKNQQR